MADLVSLDPATLATFLAMGVVTYAMRACGYWMMGRIALTDRMRRGLEALPGSLIVATVLPVALAKGIPASVCLLVSALAMAIVKRDIVAVFAGLAAAAGLRYAGF